MPGGAAEDLLGHHGPPPLGHPAIGAGDVLAVHLNNRSELRVEAGAGFIAFAHQSQVFVFTVAIVEHRITFFEIVLIINTDSLH